MPLDVISGAKRYFRSHDIPSVDLGSAVLGNSKIALVGIPLPTSVVEAVGRVKIRMSLYTICTANFV